MSVTKDFGYKMLSDGTLQRVELARHGDVLAPLLLRPPTPLDLWNRFNADLEVRKLRYADRCDKLRQWLEDNEYPPIKMPVHEPYTATEWCLRDSQKRANVFYRSQPSPWNLPNRNVCGNCKRETFGGVICVTCIARLNAREQLLNGFKTVKAPNGETINMATDDTCTPQQAKETTTITMSIEDFDNVLTKLVSSYAFEERRRISHRLTSAVVRPKKTFYDSLIEDSTLRLLKVIPDAFAAGPLADGSPAQRLHTACLGAEMLRIEYFVNKNKTVDVCFSIHSNLTQSHCTSVFRFYEKPSDYRCVEEIVRRQWGCILPTGFGKND